MPRRLVAVAKVRSASSCIDQAASWDGWRKTAALAEGSARSLPMASWPSCVAGSGTIRWCDLTLSTRATSFQLQLLKMALASPPCRNFANERVVTRPRVASPQASAKPL